MYKQRNLQKRKQGKIGVIMICDYHIELKKKGNYLRAGVEYLLDISSAEFLLSIGMARMA